MYGIGEHYAIDDDVLPILDLHPTVDMGVKPCIEPRKYEWLRDCPDICSIRIRSHIPLDGPSKRRFASFPEELRGSIAAQTAVAGRSSAGHQHHGQQCNRIRS